MHSGAVGGGAHAVVVRGPLAHTIVASAACSPCWGAAITYLDSPVLALAAIVSPPYRENSSWIQ